MRRGCRAQRIAALAALALVPATATAQDESKGIIIPPVVFRVGAFGAPCTHATLSAAIAAASTSGTTEIRLADNQVYNGVNVNVAGKNVTIIGGYVDCAAASPLADARTSLIGGPGDADSVIEVIGGVNERTVVLRNLEIEGGEADADGGGGLEVDGSAIVTLDNVRIFDNASTDGGGVHLSGATNPVELRVVGTESQIGGGGGNDASDDGGGVYCEQATIRVDSELAVFSNEAASAGGGLYLDDCNLVVGQLGVDEARLQVASNLAVVGGGLWAGNGSLLTLRGERHLIYSNEAKQAGGAMFLTGAVTSAFVDSVNFINNEVVNDFPIMGASAYGGAVYLQDGASADFDGGLPQPCQPPSVQALACVLFNGNRVETLDPFGVAHGGAFYVDDAELRVRQARLANNAADTGTVAWARGAGAQLVFESVVAEDNAPGENAFAFFAGADATIAFSSLIDASDGIPIRVAGAGTTLGFHASLFYGGEAAGVDFDGAASVLVSCLLGPPFGSAVPTIDVVFDSDFTNTTIGDYRPDPDSRLIDRCTNSPYAPTSRDAIGVARPVDDPEQVNDPGTYDVGAYERVPTLVFADSFEDAP